MEVHERLKYMQSLPLEEKVKLSRERIIEWYDAWEGDVCISFSGGKDSTVMLHLVRSIYPNVKAVFSNTGLEYPEIISFVNTIDNVEKVRPNLPFHKVIQKYGYPIISKETSRRVEEIRITKSEKLLKTRLFGFGPHKSGRLANKWKFLLDAPFKISPRCCYFLKHGPLKRFQNPYIGNMVSDSALRRQVYLRNGGCNSYEGVKRSYPLSFWLEKDVWDYIKTNRISYSKIYDMGYKRTGCMFCMFGTHREKEPNKFQLMQKTHPKLWEYCIYDLGLGQVMDYLHISYKSNLFEDWI